LLYHAPESEIAEEGQHSAAVELALSVDLLHDA